MCILYPRKQPDAGVTSLPKKEKKKPDTERVKYYSRNAWQQKECKLQNDMHKYAPTLHSRRWDEQDVRDSFVVRKESSAWMSRIRPWAMLTKIGSFARAVKHRRWQCSHNTQGQHVGTTQHVKQSLLRGRNSAQSSHNADVTTSNTSGIAGIAPRWCTKQDR